jgi:hypothetical protein
LDVDGVPAKMAVYRLLRGWLALEIGRGEATRSRDSVIEVERVLDQTEEINHESNCFGLFPGRPS